MDPLRQQVSSIELHIKGQGFSLDQSHLLDNSFILTGVPASFGWVLAKIRLFLWHRLGPTMQKLPSGFKSADYIKVSFPIWNQDGWAYSSNIWDRSLAVIWLLGRLIWSSIGQEASLSITWTSPHNADSSVNLTSADLKRSHTCSLITEGLRWMFEKVGLIISFNLTVQDTVSALFCCISLRQHY